MTEHAKPGEAQGDSLPQGTFMPHLSHAARDVLPDSAFGLPESRAYPMPNAVHTRNARARAASEFNRGILSAVDRARIDAKAERLLSQT